MNRFASFFGILVALVVSAVASGQCVDCGQSVMSSASPVVTSVSYGTPVVTSVTTYSSSCVQSQAADFSLPCAVQGVQAFSACRANGGRILGCAAEGFGTYLSCNGGVLSRMRARRVQRRQVRSRSRSSSSCY